MVVGYGWAVQINQIKNLGTRVVLRARWVIPKLGAEVMVVSLFVFSCATSCAWGTRPRSIAQPASVLPARFWVASGAFDAPKFFEVGGAGVTWLPFICPGQNAFDVEASRAVSAGGDATWRSVELALCSAFGAGSDPGFVRGRQMRGEPCVIGGAQTASNPPPRWIVVMVWADKGVRDFVEDDATNGVSIIEIGERSGQSDRLRPVDAGSCSAFCCVEFECPVAQFGGVHQYARFFSCDSSIHFRSSQSGRGHVSPIPCWACPAVGRRRRRAVLQSTTARARSL